MLSAIIEVCEMYFGSIAEEGTLPKAYSRRKRKARMKQAFRRSIVNCVVNL